MHEETTRAFDRKQLDYVQSEADEREARTLCQGREWCQMKVNDAQEGMENLPQLRPTEASHPCAPLFQGLQVG